MSELWFHIRLTHRRVGVWVGLLVAVWAIAWLRSAGANGSDPFGGAIDLLIVVAWAALGVALFREGALRDDGEFWRSLPIRPGTRLLAQLGAMGWIAAFALLIQSNAMPRLWAGDEERALALMLCAVDLVALLLLSGAVAKAVPDRRLLPPAIAGVLIFAPLLTYLFASRLGVRYDLATEICYGAVAALLSLLVLTAASLSSRRRLAAVGLGAALVAYPIAAPMTASVAHTWIPAPQPPPETSAARLAVLSSPATGAVSGAGDGATAVLLGRVRLENADPEIELWLSRAEWHLSSSSDRDSSGELSLTGRRLTAGPGGSGPATAIPLVELPGATADSGAGLRGELTGVVHGEAYRPGYETRWPLQVGNLVPGPDRIRIRSIERTGRDLVIGLSMSTLAVPLAVRAQPPRVGVVTEHGQRLYPTGSTMLIGFRVLVTPTWTLSDLKIELRYDLPPDAPLPSIVEVLSWEYLGPVSLPFRVDDFRAENFVLYRPRD